MARWFGIRRANRAPEEEGVANVLSEAERRISAVVSAARQAAEQIKADHERLSSDSQSHVISKQRLISDLMQALAERAATLERDARELARILERAAKHLPGDPRPAADQPAVTQAPTPSPAQGTPPAQASETRETPAPKTAGPFVSKSPAKRDARRRGAPPSEGVRLLATQMAVAGSSREEITVRLNRDFGIDDPGEILAEVMDPGSR